MGDIADMMLDGTLDSETGEYLGPAVGYPRTARTMGNPVYAVYKWAHIQKIEDDRLRELATAFIKDKYPLFTFRATNPKKLFNQQVKNIISQMTLDFEKYVKTEQKKLNSPLPFPKRHIS